MSGRSVLLGAIAFITALFLPTTAAAQLAQICGETGGPVWLASNVVFGKVTLKGLEPGVRFPKVTVTLNSNGRDTASYTIDRTGNYCFRGSDGSGAILTVEVEGREVARQVLAASTYLKQYHQDFEIFAGDIAGRGSPSTISVKYQHRRSEANTKLLGEATTALEDGKSGRAIELYREIVVSDPSDFIVWSQLGALYFEKKQYPNAEKAYTAALKAKPGLAPALMNLGRIHLVNGQIEPAIEMLRNATTADPSLARAFQLLGEAYLLVKKGTLGVEALNEAIRLEPVAMAESHLLLAMLFDRAGAKHLAAREYKLFLEKVPDHKDAKKFKRYVEDNPDTGQ